MTYLPSDTRYDAMIYRRCGRSGLKLPAISLGLWHNFGGVDTLENACAMIHRAFDLGITHFDLANNYGPPPGSAEENFGRILAQDLAAYRDELIISTKAGYLMWPGPYGEWGSRKYLIASLDQSLKRMGLEYVDIFYSHRPDPDTPLEETMGALDHAVRQGKALYAGISNYRPEQTRQAVRILRELGTPCLIHQPSYSMFNRWIEGGLLDVLEEEGVGCIVFSPLAQGLLTAKYLDGIPEDSRAARPHGFLRPEQVTAADMTVTLYDALGGTIIQGTTDAEGVVELDAAAGEPLVAVGQTGDAITVAGMDGAWRTGYGYWYWWWDGGDSVAADAYRVYLYTDRPIYRPGHTVHFAAILRQDLDGAYTPVDASQPITATLRDSRNNVVATQVLSPDPFGTVNGDFTLAAEPPMGAYHIELEVGGGTYQQAFRVEAYRKPEYQVGVVTSIPYAVAGDDVVVTVQADYFFGQPVAGADVVLKVFRRTGYGYPWLPEPGEQVGELQGVTDSTGRWTKTYTPDGRLGRDADYTFVATVTDASRQPVEGRQALPVYWNTFGLALTTEKYGYQPGEPVVAQITARGHDGTSVAGEVITMTVGRGYRDGVVDQQQVTTDAQGQAQASFSGLPQGWYGIAAEALDARGRQIESRSYVWVYDRSGGWWYSSDDELSITADRDAYAPGDTAQLLIESRVMGMALLTLERGAVYEEQVVLINGPATTVDVLIGEDFAPNVFAEVHIFKPGIEDGYGYLSIPEGQLLMAEVELPVSAESRRLSLDVRADASQYRPGDQVSFGIRVTDASGDPVEALVGLALVDEAIFALAEDLSADIFDTFWGRRSNSVITYDSLTPRRTYCCWVEYPPIGSPTPTPSPLATPTPGPRAADLGQSTRREFRDTAYWNPSIPTGPDGQITVTVHLPDNLTTWRVIARAVTLDTKVGDATTSILVRSFDVDVLADDGPDLGGFGLTLTFDPARLRVDRVTWDAALGSAMALGPRIDNEAGRVAFGAFAVPSGVTGNRLATITFVGQRVGQAELEVQSVEAVDGQGRALEGGATLNGGVRIEKMTWYLPLVRR